MNSPIEQFDLIVKIPIIMNIFDLSINQVIFFIIMTLFLILFLKRLYLGRIKIVPFYGQFLFEAFYKFIINLINDQIGKVVLDFFHIYILYLYLYYLLIYLD